MDKLLEDHQNYDAEKDPSGAYGRSLVDSVFQKYGRYDVNNIIKEEKEKEQWKEWREIAFRRFPPLLPGDTILVRELKARFKELREAGYDVKSYSKLTKSESWDYFREIKKNINSKLFS